MPDHAAFLKEIIAHPNDDVPRLVYADWLDEQGDPRGEFIRIQCLISQLPFEDDRRWALETRETLLKRQYGKGWANPLRPMVSDWEFHRGFVERITIRADRLLEQAGTIFQVAPVRGVRILHPESQLSAVAASPWLERLTSLDLRQSVLDLAEFGDLAYSPDIINLRELNLCDTGLCNDQGLRMLAQCDYLRNLTALDFSQFRGRTLFRGANSIGAGAIQEFSDSPAFKKLTSLNLSGYGENGARMIAALANTSLLAQLQKLDLSHNGNALANADEGLAPDPALSVLFASPNIAQLRHLRLARNQTAASSQSFAESPQLRNLESLHIGGTWLGSRYRDYLAEIANSPNVRNLVSLDLSGCTIDDAAFRSLFSSGLFKNLQELNLNETPLSDEALFALAESPLLINLRCLRLQGAGESSQKRSPIAKGLAALLRAGKTARMEILDLGNHRIGGGLDVEAISQAMPRLCSLGLWNTALTKSELDTLCESSAFPRLELLDVRGSENSDETKSRLRNRFGAGVRFGPGPKAKPTARAE